MERIKALQIVRNYVDGKWIEPDSSGHLDIKNPSTGQIIGKAPLSTVAEVIRLPIGVFAMIAPFNFPAMVPF